MQMRGRRHWVLNKQLLNLIFYENLGGGTKRGWSCSAVIVLLYCFYYSPFFRGFVCFYHTEWDSEGQGSLACCSPRSCRVGQELATEQPPHRARRSMKVSLLKLHTRSFSTIRTDAKLPKFCLGKKKNSFFLRQQPQRTASVIIAQWLKGAGSEVGLHGLNFTFLYVKWS